MKSIGHPVPIEIWRMRPIGLLYGLALGLTVLTPSCALTGRGRAPSAAPTGPRSSLYPTAELVHLDNPSQAAILRHAIRASLDPAANLLKASDRLTVLHAPGVPATTALPFILWKELKVESVEGEGVALRWEAAERMNPRAFWRRPPYDALDGYEKTQEIRLYPETGAAWPETLRFTVRYSGTVMDSLQPPKAAYARSFENTAGLIEPRGAFLAGSSTWVPTRPDEVFTFLLEAETPPDWRSVSQGGLIKTHEEGSPLRHTDTWDCPFPMDEVYLVAGPWKLTERPHGKVQAQTFTYADTDSSIIGRYLDGTGDYLDLYGKLIGPYPFPKFALVENFWQTGFGMPSFTLLGNKVIRLPFILHTSYGHEILHNWWGNSVFVDADSGNWCEGLTTYGADYLYKVRESSEAARQYRLNALSGYLDYVSGSEDIPLSDFRERHDFATQAVGYSKSMMVIHQLYRQAGEDRFWASLQEFYKQNIWRRASWGDLLRSFEIRAGVEAEAFRRQWILRPGAPSVHVQDAGRVKKPEGWEVRATLSQTVTPPAPPMAAQTVSPTAADTAGEPYSLTIPVRLRFAGGADTTWQVTLNSKETTWSVRTKAEPTMLLVDPDYDVMRRIDPREIPPTLSRVLGSDTVTVLIAGGLPPGEARAYRALAAEWSKGQILQVVNEDSLNSTRWTPPGNAWFLGLGPVAVKGIASLPEVRSTAGRWQISGKDYPESTGVVLTGSLDPSGKRAWALIAVPDSSQVAVIGSKVPHYGKYSYLAFDRGKNIGQGVWSQIDSPLIVDFVSKGSNLSDPSDVRGK